MKRVVFVCGHVASGSSELVAVMNQNDRVQIETTHLVYAHPLDLDTLFKRGHKCRNSAAIYGDHLLYNINFQCRRLYDWADFIFVIRGGRDALRELAFHENYTVATVYRYYCFRLRRLYEMQRRAKRSLLLTWSDLVTGSAYPKVDQFLDLRVPLVAPKKELFNRPAADVNVETAEKAQDAFEYYYYRMKDYEKNNSLGFSV